MPEDGSTEKSPAAESVPTDAGAATDVAGWLDLLGQIAEEEGSFEAIGKNHHVLFVDDGKTLLVSFESIQSARARPGQMPLAHDIAAARGWSHLCFISDGETWFRDPAVYAHFDALVDDAFFDGYSRILFYGAGMGGYAACAYAVAAPGAQVLALNPRATLDPAQAGWDKRDISRRRLDFTSRYGYAPDMLESAGHVTVIHDSSIPEEAMHAALFRGDFITRLSTPYLGDKIETALINLGILPDLIEAAMKGKLGVEDFAKLWRARRDYAPYLRAILARAEAAGRIRHEKMICRSVTKRLSAPRFAKRLTKLMADETVAKATPVTADTP